MCWNCWGLSLHLKCVTKPKNTYLQKIPIYKVCVQSCVAGDFWHRQHTKSSEFPAAPLAKLSMQSRSQVLPARRRWRSPPPPALFLTAGGSLVSAVCGPALGLLFWSVLVKVSTPLLSSDTGPRTEWCDVLVALLRGLAADAGPEARFVFPLAVEGVGSGSWMQRWCTVLWELQPFVPGCVKSRSS